MACELVDLKSGITFVFPFTFVLLSDADADSPTLLLFAGLGGVRGTDTRDRDVRLFYEVRVRFRPLSLLVIAVIAVTALGGRVRSLLADVLLADWCRCSEK